LGLVVVGAAVAGLGVRYFGDNDPAAFGVSVLFNVNRACFT